MNSINNNFPGRDNTEIDKNIIYSVINFIIINYKENYSLEALSKKFEIPLSTLKAKFIQIVGLPVHDYIILTKMEKAAGLLLAQENYIIKHIAKQLGFKPHGFHKRFKKYCGLTPRLFRAKYLKRLIAP